MKWFREWRAWVRDRETAREDKLVAEILERVRDIYPGATPSDYWAKSVIIMIRRHDKEGV
jgi:hypothetical protein